MFEGKRNADAIKSKIGRLKKTFDYIVAFEDHTGGGGDGDDDDLPRSQQIANKLESARRFGADVGDIKAAEIEKWEELGWYRMVNGRSVAMLLYKLPIY